MNWLFKIWHGLRGRVRAPRAVTSADWQDAYENEHRLRVAAERTIRDLLAHRKRKERG